MKTIKNIVFFEDDPHDCEIYLDAIQGLNGNYRVKFFTEMGPEFYEEFSPSQTLVFLDLKLGSEFGTDLYHRNLRPRKFLTFVHTSSDNPVDLNRCRNAGLSVLFLKQNTLEKIREQFFVAIKFAEYNALAPL